MSTLLATVPVPATTQWTWPIDVNRYDRSPELTSAEQLAIRAILKGRMQERYRRAPWCSSLRRLLAPILDSLHVADAGHTDIFAAAQFAFNRNVGASFERTGKPCKLPERHTPMPVRTRFPGSGVVLPRRLRRQREDGDIGGAGNLLFGVVADETDERHSVEVHKILLVLPACLGHPERVGAAPKGKELLFWGDRNGGARTGTAR